ncbi:MAG: glutathione binding-like protein [Lysobacterales bacterium]
MIDVHYWATPNGHKISIFLEETATPYSLIPVHIGRGEQFESAFLRIAPNNRVPAIVDQQPADGGDPISVFESGAILVYLAEKTGQFLPTEPRQRKNVMEWLFWQMAGLGPMLGQNHHFGTYAPERIPYAIERYVAETQRLYNVLNRQLENQDFVAGSYSIADMACYPWIVPHQRQGQTLSNFPALERWFKHMAERPAVQRAYEKGDALKAGRATVDDEARQYLFGQTDARAPDRPG